MDPQMFNRLGNIQHEENIAWSEAQLKGEPRWKLPNVFAIIRQRMTSAAPQPAPTFKATTNPADC